MKLNKKNIAALGFKSDPWTSRESLTLHWRAKKDRVEFVDGIRRRLGIFRMTPKQLQKFADGKLSLVPQGFCAPMRTSKKEILEGGEIIYVGPVRSKKHLEQLFADHREI